MSREESAWLREIDDRLLAIQSTKEMENNELQVCLTYDRPYQDKPRATYTFYAATKGHL